MFMFHSFGLAAAQISILENQLTNFSLHYNNTETLGGTWFNSLFSLPFKLTKTEEILIRRYVDADSQRCSYKPSEPMQRNDKRESLL